MNDASGKRGFATRPTDVEGWIKANKTPPCVSDAGTAFTARLTIDVTPALRGRIKIAAFKRSMTAAEMLRSLLEREFPAEPGEAP